MKATSPLLAPKLSPRDQMENREGQGFFLRELSRLAVELELEFLTRTSLQVRGRGRAVRVGVRGGGTGGDLTMVTVRWGGVRDLSGIT